MRSFLSTVLIVLVAVLTPLSALAVWADREIGDTDGYVTAMAPLASDRDVEDAVADRVTDEVMKEFATSDAADEVRGLVHDAVLSFAGTDAYRTAWNTVNQAAHTAVEKALTSYEGETASVDLAPVIEQLKAQLSKDGVPYAHEIPVGDATITVLDHDTLGSAREVFDTLQLAGVWLPLLTLLLMAAVLLVARRRLPELALALAAGGLLLLLAVALARFLALNDLPLRVNRPAADAAFDALTATLRLTAWCLMTAGVLVAALVRRGRHRKLGTPAGGEVGTPAGSGAGAEGAAGAGVEGSVPHTAS
ncbi:hypothetical protein ACH4E8_16080 [Streptomyces sp. NPDC017979]|uniref:hypothetical protein n=1 Tax=Streptomyces sp. NPDC017979 TaxID=3365024 RepID=UPI0037B5885B